MDQIIINNINGKTEAELNERNLRMNYQEEIQKVANWMKEYADRAGTKGFVCGLSGGIDSSVIACLAVKAVGKENVIGVSLPCQTREDMRTDAKKLAENLDIKFITINLIDSFNVLGNYLTISGLHDEKEDMSDEEANKAVTLCQANMKARLRMTALYAVAGLKNYLVAGTGNKSELMVGYCTKFGDGAVDMEPLGQYYKSEVYKMADLMPDIPDGVKTKAPSADLWEGQTDEDELGMTYDELEESLRYIAERCKTGTHSDDTPNEQTMKVVKMVYAARHKNRVPPQYDRDEY